MSTSTASSPSLTTGKEILSYCTRCRMDLTHTIAAMMGDRVVRVHCKTCRSDHNYRPAKGEKASGKAASATAARSASPRAPRSAAAKAVAVEEAWESRIRDARSKPLQTYAASAQFHAGDRLAHPTFGEGVVQKLIYPNKIEIIFQMDVKTLIHKP